jgi:hypothetical protein
MKISLSIAAMKSSWYEEEARQEEDRTIQP